MQAERSQEADAKEVRAELAQGRALLDKLLKRAVASRAQRGAASTVTDGERAGAQNKNSSEDSGAVGGSGNSAGASGDIAGEVRLDTGLAMRRAGLADELTRLLLEEDTVKVVEACHALYRLVIRSRRMSPRGWDPSGGEGTRAFQKSSNGQDSELQKEDVNFGIGRGKGGDVAASTSTARVRLGAWEGGQEDVWRALLEKLMGLRQRKIHLSPVKVCADDSTSEREGGGMAMDLQSREEVHEARRGIELDLQATNSSEGRVGGATDDEEKVLWLRRTDLEALGLWLSDAVRAAGRSQWATTCGAEADTVYRLEEQVRAAEADRRGVETQVAAARVAATKRAFRILADRFAATQEMFARFCMAKAWSKTELKNLN